MTRPKHHIDASWPAESCPRQPHASWLVDRLALIHSTSSWSSNPHNAPSPTEPYAPSSFTHFGRNLYEAPAETLVGSSIDASRASGTSSDDLASRWTHPFYRARVAAAQ